MMDKYVTIKELTDDDYDEVITIRKPEDVYRGMDYLPDYYRMLLRLPGYKGYGAVVKGKIVAVFFVGIIDGGMTAVGRASRISKEYEGKGIYRYLDSYIIPIYKNMPGLIGSTATINNENYEKNARSKVQSQQYKLVVEKVIHTYSMNMKDVKHYRSQPVPQTVKVLQEEDFVEIFETPGLCRKLFPDGRIAIDKVPFRLMKENICHILTERCTAVGSNISSRQNVTSEDLLLTCGNYAVCAGGLLYNLDIYGYNIEDLKHHMVHHLERLINLNKPHTEIHLEVICYEDIKKDDINNIMQSLGFQRIDFFRTHMYCVDEIWKSTESDKTVNQTNSKL